MDAEAESGNSSENWKKFLRKHWQMAALFVVVAIALVIGAVLVYLWFVGDAQSTNLVPSTLRLWSMGHVVTFLLHLIFWEIVLVGVPAIIAAIAGWLWWRRLSDEEKKEYHFFGTRSRAESGGSGGISLLLFIAFCIKVYLDGNWNDAISTWSLDYLVYSCLTALVWILIIFGIPIALGLIWWIHHQMSKKP
jgi:predicted permease